MREKVIFEEKKVLEENWLENTLLIAGFVPVIGEVADIISIIRYTYKKEYIYAGLMLIALIPTVGDIVAKPIIWIFRRMGKAGKLLLKNTDETVKFLNSNLEAKNAFVRIGKYTEHSTITKIINQLNKISPRLGAQIEKAINEIKVVLQKIAPRTTRIGQEAGKNLVAGASKPISKAIKGVFRERRIAQYAERNGIKPSNFVSKLYSNILARRDRRNYFRKLVMKSNLLKFFGLPNLSLEERYEKFEEKLVNDENYRTELANNEEFTHIVNQSVNQADIDSLTNQQSGASQNSGAMSDSAIQQMLAGPQGLRILKYLAANLA